MAKMTSFRWAKKDDPMFTGRFHFHSVKKLESGQKNIRVKKNDKLDKKVLEFYSSCYGNMYSYCIRMFVL